MSFSSPYVSVNRRTGDWPVVYVARSFDSTLVYVARSFDGTVATDDGARVSIQTRIQKARAANGGLSKV